MGPELFQEVAFAPVDETAWRRLVEKALKGKSFDEAFVSHSDDGIPYGPIAGRVPDGHLHGRSSPDEPWTVSQRCDDPDAERARVQLEADIDGGATGITFCLQGAAAAHGYGLDPATVAPLLEKAAGTVEIRLEAPEEEAGRLIDIFEEKDEASAHVDFGLSPLVRDTDALRRDAARAFDLDLSCTVFRADGRLAHNAGASEAQELAFALGALAEALRLGERMEIDAESALAATEIVLAADQNQFLTIAKLRAMRRLHARLLNALAIDEPFAPHIHAVTSWRMLTRLDPETNILRNTIAVFAAGVGGADSISVLPHSFPHGLPDRFARRIARNTQTVLIDESHLAHVIDPAAGSGGVEGLTSELAARAWRGFQEIEREGGLKQSPADGGFASRVSATREKRAEAIAAGRQPIVGTTIYPMSEERSVSVLVPRSQAREAEDALAPISLCDAWKKEDAA
jgi:methylmalonyl-CoA mutase